jgi:DNA repair protein RadC
MKKEIEPIYEFLDEKATLEDIRTIVKMCDTFWSLRDSSYYAKSITEPERIIEKCNWMKFEEQENLICFTLNSANQIINMHKITKGLVNQTPVHPREAFRKAILDNAVSIIFCHNHPSGDIKESNEDIAITRVLTAAGKIVEIPVLDHIIIGKSSFNSLARKYPEMFETDYK